MKKQRYMLGVGALACLALVLTMAQSHAGNGGTEFSGTWTTLQGWVEGTLGKIITTGMVLTGVGMGIARQNLMPLAVGAGGGLGLYSTPTILGQVFSGTIPVSAPTAWLAAQPVFDLPHLATMLL